MDNLKALNIDATSFEHARSGGEHAASGRSRHLACVRLRTPRSSFITDPSCWLGHSTFFAALFAGKSGSAMDDGSFFIDCDSDLFTHVLQYLRTAVLPIFYDTTRGHDFAQYHALLGEAEYFGIDRLSKWLRSKRYLDAVHIHYVGDTSSDLVTYAPSDVNGRPFTHKDCQFLEVPTDEHKNIQLMPITPQPYVPHHPVDGKVHQTIVRVVATVR